MFTNFSSYGRRVAENLFYSEIKTTLRLIVARLSRDHLFMMKTFLCLLLALSLGGCVWYGPGGYNHGWHGDGGGYGGGAYNGGYNGGYHQGGWH